MNWLIKEEPTHYSFDDLLRDGRTAWSGVRNPVAQKHLQSMRAKPVRRTRMYRLRSCWIG